jgi:hypothetical protein
VFGVLKRDDKVYLKIVPNASREELMPIVQGKILEGWALASTQMVGGHNTMD